MNYGIFSLTTVQITVFWVLNILHVFKYHRINVRKLDVSFCFFFITVHLKTSTTFSEVEMKAKLQAVCRSGETVFLSEAVWLWVHVMKGMPVLKWISVLGHSLIWLAPWFSGVMGGMAELFLCEWYFEYLMAEGEFFEAENYTFPQI